MVLDRDAVVPRRACPTDRSLILAGETGRLARTEVLGALPAVLRPEHRSERFEPPVQRAQAPRSSRLRDVERVAEPVVVLVDLARSRRGEVGVAVRAAEAPRPVRLDVDLGLPFGDELGERLAQAARAPEAVQREPGGGPEPVHPRHRPEQRVAVGGHRVGVADEGDHTRVLQEREAANGAGHQLLEPGVVRRQRLRAVLPRHAVLPAGDRVRLVASEEHAAALRLAVDEIVRVAETRRLARENVALDRVERDVLMVDRDRAEERAGERRDARRPHPRRVHDGVGVDRAVLGVDTGDHPVADRDPGDQCPGADLGAELARRRSHGVRRDVRVDVAVAGHPHRAEERLG